MTKKSCSRCKKIKEELDEFYMCAGKFRSECKCCTIKRNVKYQRRVQAWKYRFRDEDARKAYMHQYYAKNLPKFAEYRAKFKKEHPHYHRDWWRLNKQKKPVE